MIVGLSYCLGRARLDARGAENTFTQVERDRIPGWPRDRLCRTNRHARVAAVGTFRRLDAQRAAVTVGQRWRRAVRKRQGLAAMSQAMKDGFVGKHGQRSKPQ